MEPNLILLLSTILVAAFVQRLAGFGFGLVAAPIAMTMFTPFEVSFFMAYWGISNSLPTAILTRRSIDWGLVNKILWWMILGVGLGYLGLVFLPEAIFKTLALVLCVQAFISVFWPALATRGIEWSANNRVAGTTAGLLQATTGVPGPPLIVFFNSIRVSREAFVAVFALVFLVVAGVRILVGLGFVAASPHIEAAAEMLPDRIPFYLLVGSGVSVVGVVLAQLVERYISLSVFRKIAAFLIAGSALALLVDLIGRLL